MEGEVCERIRHKSRRLVATSVGDKFKLARNRFSKLTRSSSKVNPARLLLLLFKSQFVFSLIILIYCIQTLETASSQANPADEQRGSSRNVVALVVDHDQIAPPEVAATRTNSNPNSKSNSGKPFAPLSQLNGLHSLLCLMIGNCQEKKTEIVQ